MIWVTAIVALLTAPATAAVASPPAVDQYTEHLPGAGGNSSLGDGGTPFARPGLLSKETQAALAGPDADRDGEALAQIATSPDLGAPADASAGEGTGVGSGDEQGLATVVADTAMSAPGLALIGALGGIALAGGWTRSIRRGRSSG